MNWILAGLCSLSVSGAQNGVVEQPNVLLIISDDQSWTDFGFMGHPEIRTPHLDVLEEHLDDEYSIHAALKGDEVVAATLTFHNANEAAIFYIGTTQRANRECQATKFLIAKCSEWAVKKGVKTMDLGRSRRDTGAAAFNEHQGFAPSELNYRYALLDERAAVPSLNPSNPKTDFARKVWSKMPLWACDLLTARLGRYLA